MMSAVCSPALSPTRTGSRGGGVNVDSGPRTPQISYAPARKKSEAQRVIAGAREMQPLQCGVRNPFAVEAHERGGMHCGLPFAVDKSDDDRPTSFLFAARRRAANRRKSEKGEEVFHVQFVHASRLSRSVHRGRSAAIMAAQLIDGKAVAKSIEEEVAAAIARLGFAPGLVAVRVGNDPASEVYVRNKARKARELGLRGDELILPDSTTEAELLAHVDRLNRDDDVDGILVQLPLPKQIDATR